ncbi:UNVERIFIED_CONTAM: Transposon Tf2-12 polyprotein [Sesamum latifolium]|uniref:Transposon Tf2-12 polyprotein n=1 Tax=Sesamum latifolium TaxID=2727402 RepID=A0AAW2U5P8_9LAMI
MAVNVAHFKLKGIAKDSIAPKNNVPYEKPQRNLTLKEMQARQYPFIDSDVFGIFDNLLEANVIDLPEMKRPEEAERKDDPKYCKYHRLVGHIIQDCFVFKDKVMQLARQSKISLEEDSAAANVIMIKSRYLNSNKNSCNVVHRDDIEDGLLEKEDSSDTDDCMSIITFTDEDLLLGSKPHNRPLFVVGYPPHDPRLQSRRTKGCWHYKATLTMEDMVSTSLFHVIDAKTSYNMLLGRPWLHENAVVPSTWHQCFKYCHNGIVKKVLGDNKPFTEAESHFADAKYYIEGAKKEKEVLPSEEPKSYSKSTRKNDSSTIKVELSKDLILPLTQISLKQPSRPPLKGFVPSTQEEEGGHEVLAIDEKGFDPKAFKLLVKAGYNPKEKPSLGKLPPEATGEMLHGLNATQIMLKEKGHAVQDSQVGLGFTPPKPVRIAIRRTTLTISYGKVLKVKAQTMVFTQVQSDDEDNRKSVASSNYINSSTEEDFAQIYHVTLIEDSEIEEEDAEDAPVELEEGVKATVDELREINLGNTEDPRPIYTSASLTQEEEEAYIMLLHEFKDVFAWSYKEIPGLDPKVAVHHLIVPVRKKNGQVRVCVDFRDLNNACPKGDFPLPIAELMIDATTGHEVLSFMDGSSGYNQIRMAPADEELTAFRTPKERIFDDMLHKNVECYIDDLVVKSKKREDHLYDLRKVFERLRRYQLKMNPSKCAFGVTSEKFLGFIVRQRGIEIEQAKIDAILRMPEPRNIHELKVCKES